METKNSLNVTKFNDIVSHWRGIIKCKRGVDKYGVRTRADGTCSASWYLGTCVKCVEDHFERNS